MFESEEKSSLRCIVSGGQTGVDRGALDAALELGLAHGGWCPRGRRSEDGCIPTRYQLRETESSNYPVRTRRNVLDSDATLLIYRDRLVGGTELTFRLARQLAKPYLLVDLQSSPDVTHVLDWIRDAHIETLNVAGPRESTAPGIERQTREFLVTCLASMLRTS